MSALAFRSTAAPSVIDIDIVRLVLDVRGRIARSLDARVQNSITDGELERTTDGASTLRVTLHDPDRALLQSGLFSHTIDAKLDRFWFRLVQVSKQDDQLALTFEDRDVARLRAVHGPRKVTTGHGGVKKVETARRARVTRAEFALALVRELHPAPLFVCPQLHTRQEIADQADTRKGRRQLPYQYRRGAVDGRLEDSWACLQRLASEVNWRCFSNEGRVYFVSDDDLLALSKPVHVNERTLGVATIDFDIDNGKVVNEVTISARAARWAADPGTVVTLSELGPADGTWLVHDVRRGLYDADATITLRKRGKQLKEPAAETEEIPAPRTRDGRTLGKLSASKSSDDGASSADTAATNAVEQSYAAALAIHNHHYPYVWGGGHARAGVADRGTGRDPGIGYDCSGAVCAVLAAGGLGLRPGGPAPTSGPLMGWGAAGNGRYLTVYTNPVHAFVVFHTTRGNQHFGTGRWGKSWGGAGFNPTMHTLSGFVARHWPGT